MFNVIMLINTVFQYLEILKKLDFCTLSGEFENMLDFHIFKTDGLKKIQPSFHICIVTIFNILSVPMS